MKTSKEVEQDFRKELKDLRDKYKCEISIENLSHAYGSTPVIEVYIPTVWDDNCNEVAQSACFNFGDRI